MLAIIMAGGEGERLRPLTCAIPKPMVLLLDKPILSYSLELLKKHNIEKAALTLGYLPERIIDEFGDGSDYGIELKYYTEQKPMGTAGGVLNARDFLTETFCVLSGDGVTDIDLTEAYKFHKSKGALATLVLKRVSNPNEYGLVSTDDDGRVIGFSEKPSWSGVTTDTANTGVYILEPEIFKEIPENRAYDFGKELFPSLVRRSAEVYGYLTDGYWCDIGDIRAYMKAQADALDGKISFIRPPENGIFRMSGAIVDDGARIEAPAYIGAGARIERGAHIGAYSVLGTNSVVAETASIKRSVLYPGALAGAGAALRGCVMAARSVIGANASAFEECVIADDTIIGKSACLKPGVKIWPLKRVPDGMTVNENIVWGQRADRAFDGYSIRTRTPEEAVRAGRAIAWKQKVKTALTGRSASSVSDAQERALCAGLAAQGVKVYTLGECTLPQLRYTLSATGMNAAVYALGDAVTPICEGLTYHSSSEKRAIEAALFRQDMPNAYTGITRPIERVGRSDLNYLGFLMSAAFGSIRRIRAAVYAQREQLLYLADQAFSRAGFTARVEWEEELMELAKDELGIYLSLDGENVHFADADGVFDDALDEMILSWAILENGEETLFAPPAATRSLDALAADYGASVVYARADSNEWARELAKKSMFQFNMRFDGLFAALNVLSRINESEISLSSFRERMPKVERVSRDVRIDFEKRGETLRRFSVSAPDDFEREELFFKNAKGCAWIRPDDDRPVCTVTAESRDVETAEEICGAMLNALKRAADSDNS